MARNDIRIDDLAKKIVESMQDYTNSVAEAISDAVDEEAKNCLKEIKANSSKWPSYAEGWKITYDTKYDSSNIYGVTKRTIWNKPDYRIVHLLEKGHAKVGGGRVEGRPHVGPAEHKYKEILTDKIERIIKNGG